MTTDERLAKLKQELAWLQLTGWHVSGNAQKRARERVEQVKRQIALIEQNRGASVSESNQ